MATTRMTQRKAAELRRQRLRKQQKGGFLGAILGSLASADIARLASTAVRRLASTAVRRGARRALRSGVKAAKRAAVKELKKTPRRMAARRMEEVDHQEKKRLQAIRKARGC